MAELLSSLIRQNSRIKGITFGREEVKVAQFADDITCVLADEQSMVELLSTLRRFTGWSGLKINKKKIISPKLFKQGQSSLQGMPITSKAKILGIWIGLDQLEESNYDWNFKGTLQKIQKTCDSWHQRNLSLKGKVTVANSLLISLLQYPCAIVQTQAKVFVEYRRMISRFLWNNKKP